MNKVWLHGLISAFIGGFAGALESGFALVLIAPETFNLNKGLGKTLVAMLVFAVLSGYKTAAAYLKQSPSPWDGQVDRRSGPADPSPAKS